MPSGPEFRADLYRGTARFVGEFEFATPHEWSVETLTGFMYSTSFLSQEALGPHVPAFESDLRTRLVGIEPRGVAFSYTLARRP